MDAYPQHRGLKSCTQGLEILSGFHFLLKEGLKIIAGKSSSSIIHESIGTDTLACGICCWEWRQAKDIINFIDVCINVKTIIIDKFEALEREIQTPVETEHIFSLLDLCLRNIHMKALTFL